MIIYSLLNESRIKRNKNEKNNKTILAKASKILHHPDFKAQLKKAYAEFRPDAKNRYAELPETFPKPVKTAVFNGDYDELKRLLDTGIDLNLWDLFDDTPSSLFIACQLNRLDMVNLLIESGEKAQGFREFHSVSLLDYDHKKEFDRWPTALIGGMRSNNPNILRLLFNKNPAILPTKVYELVLCVHTALDFGALQSILFLFEKIIKSKNTNLTLEYLKLLYGLGIPIFNTCFSTEQRKNLLLSLKNYVFCRFAIRWCSPTYIKECLDFSYQIPVSARTCGDEDLKRLIINQKDENFFHLIAKTRKSKAVVDLFIQRFGSKEILSKSFQDNPLPVWYAVTKGNLEVTKAFVEAQPLVLEHPKTGNLVELAVGYSQVNIFRYFLENHPEQIDHQEILEISTWHQDIDILKFYAEDKSLKLEIDKWRNSKNGGNLMHEITNYDVRIEALHILEKNIHDPFNLKNFNNKTPLELAEFKAGNPPWFDPKKRRDQASSLYKQWNQNLFKSQKPLDDSKQGDELKRKPYQAMHSLST